MQKMVARLNVEHFRHMLESETNAAKRQMLVRLLEEEQAKLAELNKSEEKKAASG